MSQLTEGMMRSDEEIYEAARERMPKIDRTGYTLDQCHPTYRVWISTLIAEAQADFKAEIERLKGELAESDAALEALDIKLDSLAPHGTCACSYDHPDDFCGHHSPRFMAARAEIEHLKADHAAAIEREGREVLEMACATVRTFTCGGEQAIRRAYAEREAKRKLPEPESGEGR